MKKYVVLVVMSLVIFSGTVYAQDITQLQAQYQSLLQTLINLLMQQVALLEQQLAAQQQTQQTIQQQQQTIQQQQQTLQQQQQTLQQIQQNTYQIQQNTTPPRCHCAFSHSLANSYTCSYSSIIKTYSYFYPSNSSENALCKN